MMVYEAPARVIIAIPCCKGKTECSKVDFKVSPYTNQLKKYLWKYQMSTFKQEKLFFFLVNWLEWRLFGQK